eukprot:6911447-Ditylum_brightwellii.AAC.1
MNAEINALLIQFKRCTVRQTRYTTLMSMPQRLFLEDVNLILLESRSHAWDTALISGSSRDWTMFREMATKFVKKMREAKTKVWKDFTSDLDYNTEADVVMKIVNAIHQEDVLLLPNATLQSEGGKSVCSDRGKARIFQSYYKKYVKNPRLKGQERLAVNTAI